MTGVLSKMLLQCGFGHPVAWWLMAKECKWSIEQVNKLFRVVCFLRCYYGWSLREWGELLTQLEVGM